MVYNWIAVNQIDNVGGKLVKLNNSIVTNSEGSLGS